MLNVEMKTANDKDFLKVFLEDVMNDGEETSSGGDQHRKHERSAS